MQQLPWPTGEVNFEQIVSLDGYDYIMQGLWNVRSSSWSVSLYTKTDLQEIVSGKRLDIGVNILNNAINPNRPDGYIVVTPNDSDIKLITKDNMGDEVNLVYIKDNEIQ
jgi:hypothetical protein